MFNSWFDNRWMNAEAVVEALRSSTLATVAEAVAVEGVPAEPGFYAWWPTSAALPTVPLHGRGMDGFGLLYVAIAPRRQSSSLRSRVCRQHIAGNVTASTFRSGLAALLWK